MRKTISVSIIIIITLLLSQTLIYGKNDPLYINNPKIKPPSITYNESNYDSNMMLPLRNNKMVVFGVNYYGEFGNNLPKLYTLIPEHNKFISDIISQNGGVNNIYKMNIDGYGSIIIFKNGKVYVWGQNYDGCLGLNDTNKRYVPIENKYVENIIEENGGVTNIYFIEIGLENILIFKNGKVYVWGNNRDAELGIGDHNNKILPTENTYLENIIQENGGIGNVYKIIKMEETLRIILFKNISIYSFGGSNTIPMECTNIEKLLIKNGGYNNIYKLSEDKIVFKNGSVYKIDFYFDVPVKEDTDTEKFIKDNGGLDNFYLFGDHLSILKNGSVYIKDWFINDGKRTYMPSLEQLIINNGGTNNIYKIESDNIIIFKNGSIYKWNNGEYQPKEDSKLENIILSNGGINNIYLSDFQDIIIFKNGKTYIGGMNNVGELGLGFRSGYNGVEPLTENTYIEKIIEQNGGTSNIYKFLPTHMIIFNNNNTYVWGDNENGVTGLGNYIIVPPKVVDNPYGKFTYYKDTLIVNNTKYIIYWNKNIGTIDLKNKTLSTNTIIFENNSDLYIIDNKIYKLETYTCCEKTFKIDNLKDIIQQNGGINNIYKMFINNFRSKEGGSNFLIFKNGSVYVWGDNEYGQLGTNISGEVIDNIYYGITTPTENNYIENIINRNGGVKNIYYIHINNDLGIIIFKNGSVYVWGFNEDGELGINNTEDQYLPVENNFLEKIIQENGGVNNIYKIYTEYSNIIIFKNGKVYVWGFNFFGELGLNDTNIRIVPTENKYIEQIIQENGGIKSINNIFFNPTQTNIFIFKNYKVYITGTINYETQTIIIPGTTNNNIYTTPTEYKPLEDIFSKYGLPLIGKITPSKIILNF